MIGLLTFHRANNYGAVLQAYALQKTIENMGYENEYIDFILNNPEKIKEFKRANQILKIKKLFSPIKILNQRKRANKFEMFRKRYMRISKNSYFGDRAMKTCTQYDNYIVGSDQVWNFALTNNSKSFLLDFVPDKIPKNSYATSFGVDNLSIEEKSIFQALLNRFDYISVREKEGREIIRDFLSKEVNLCIDPTMLLEKYDWEKIAVEPQNDKYVLIYAMTDTDSMVGFAKKIAQKEKLKIIAIGLKKKYKNVKNIYSAGPEEWVGYIKNASIVITNSFHGSVFSLIFNKNLYIEYLPEGWKVNSRLKNLVNEYGLHDFVLSEKGVNDKTIDYKIVNMKLLKNKTISIEYLKRICE